MTVMRIMFISLIALLFIYRIGKYRFTRFNREHFGLSVIAVILLWGTTMPVGTRAVLLCVFALLGLLFLFRWIQGKRTTPQ